MATAELPTLDVLLPLGRAGERILADPAELALARLYAHPQPAPGRSAWVRANMIASLDGAGTGADSRSGTLNGAADLRVFQVLRAVADVVLIGAGTARAEGYGSLELPAGLAAGRVGRGQRPAPELAVISGTGDLPSALLDSAACPLIITIRNRPGLGELRERIGGDRVVVAGDDRVDLKRALAELAGRGLARVLTEGGPRVLGDLLAAGCVDDLCLTWSPLVVGGPARRVVDRADWLNPALAARPAHLLHSDAVLLGRWLL